MFAPYPAQRRAKPAPIPDAPPVTTMVLSFIVVVSKGAMVSRRGDCLARAVMFLLIGTGKFVEMEVVIVRDNRTSSYRLTATRVKTIEAKSLSEVRDVAAFVVALFCKAETSSSGGSARQNP